MAKHSDNFINFVIDAGMMVKESDVKSMVESQISEIQDALAKGVKNIKTKVSIKPEVDVYYDPKAVQEWERNAEAQLNAAINDFKEACDKTKTDNLLEGLDAKLTKQFEDFKVSLTDKMQDMLKDLHITATPTISFNIDEKAIRAQIDKLQKEIDEAKARVEELQGKVSTKIDDVDFEQIFSTSNMRTLKSRLKQPIQMLNAAIKEFDNESLSDEQLTSLENKIQGLFAGIAQGFKFDDKQLKEMLPQNLFEALMGTYEPEYRKWQAAATKQLSAEATQQIKELLATIQGKKKELEELQTQIGDKSPSLNKTVPEEHRNIHVTWSGLDTLSKHVVAAIGDAQAIADKTPILITLAPPKTEDEADVVRRVVNELNEAFKSQSINLISPEALKSQIDTAIRQYMSGVNAITAEAKAMGDLQSESVKAAAGKLEVTNANIVLGKVTPKTTGELQGEAHILEHVEQTAIGAGEALEGAGAATDNVGKAMEGASHSAEALADNLEMATQLEELLSKTPQQARQVEDVAKKTSKALQNLVGSTDPITLVEDGQVTALKQVIALLSNGQIGAVVKQITNADKKISVPKSDALSYFTPQIVNKLNTPENKAKADKFLSTISATPELEAVYNKLIPLLDEQTAALTQSHRANAAASRARKPAQKASAEQEANVATLHLNNASRTLKEALADSPFATQAIIDDIIAATQADIAFYKKKDEESQEALKKLPEIMQRQKDARNEYQTIRAKSQSQPNDVELRQQVDEARAALSAIDEEMSEINSLLHYDKDTGEFRSTLPYASLIARSQSRLTGLRQKQVGENATDLAVFNLLRYNALGAEHVAAQKQFDDIIKAVNDETGKTQIPGISEKASTMIIDAINYLKNEKSPSKQIEKLIARYEVKLGEIDNTTYGFSKDVIDNLYAQILKAYGYRVKTGVGGVPILGTNNKPELVQTNEHENKRGEVYATQTPAQKILKTAESKYQYYRELGQLMRDQGGTAQALQYVSEQIAILSGEANQQAAISVLTQNRIDNNNRKIQEKQSQIDAINNKIGTTLNRQGNPLMHLPRGDRQQIARLQAEQKQLKAENETLQAQIETEANISIADRLKQLRGYRTALSRTTTNIFGEEVPKTLGDFAETYRYLQANAKQTKTQYAKDVAVLLEGGIPWDSSIVSQILFGNAATSRGYAEIGRQLGNRTAVTTAQDYKELVEAGQEYGRLQNYKDTQAAIQTLIQNEEDENRLADLLRRFFELTDIEGLDKRSKAKALRANPLTTNRSVLADASIINLEELNDLLGSATPASAGNFKSMISLVKEMQAVPRFNDEQLADARKKLEDNKDALHIDRNGLSDLRQMDETLTERIRRVSDSIGLFGEQLLQFMSQFSGDYNNARRRADNLSRVIGTQTTSHENTTNILRIIDTALDKYANTNDNDEKNRIATGLTTAIGMLPNFGLEQINRNAIKTYIKDVGEANQPTKMATTSTLWQSYIQNSDTSAEDVLSRLQQARDAAIAEYNDFNARVATGMTKDTTQFITIYNEIIQQIKNNLPKLTSLQLQKENLESQLENMDFFDSDFDNVATQLAKVNRQISLITKYKNGGEPAIIQDALYVSNLKSKNKASIKNDVAKRVAAADKATSLESAIVQLEDYMAKHDANQGSIRERIAELNKISQNGGIYSPNSILIDNAAKKDAGLSSDNALLAASRLEEISLSTADEERRLSDAENELVKLQQSHRDNVKQVQAQIANTNASIARARLLIKSIQKQIESLQSRRLDIRQLDSPMPENTPQNIVDLIQKLNETPPVITSEIDKLERALSNLVEQKQAQRKSLKLLFSLTPYDIAQRIGGITEKDISDMYDIIQRLYPGKFDILSNDWLRQLQQTTDAQWKAVNASKTKREYEKIIDALLSFDREAYFANQVDNMEHQRIRPEDEPYLQKLLNDLNAKRLRNDDISKEKDNPSSIYNEMVERYGELVKLGSYRLAPPFASPNLRTLLALASYDKLEKERFDTQFKYDNLTAQASNRAGAVKDLQRALITGVQDNEIGTSVTKWVYANVLSALQNGKITPEAAAAGITEQDIASARAQRETRQDLARRVNADTDSRTTKKKGELRQLNLELQSSENALAKLNEQLVATQTENLKVAEQRVENAKAELNEAKNHQELAKRLMEIERQTLQSQLVDKTPLPQLPTVDPETLKRAEERRRALSKKRQPQITPPSASNPPELSQEELVNQWVKTLTDEARAKYGIRLKQNGDLNKQTYKKALDAYLNATTPAEQPDELSAEDIASRLRTLLDARMNVLLNTIETQLQLSSQHSQIGEASRLVLTDNHIGIAADSDKFNPDVAHAQVEEFKSQYEQIAQNVVAGYVNAIQAGQMTFEKAGELIGLKTIQGTQDSLEIHSPSKVMYDLGMYTIAGFEKGVIDKTTGLKMTGEQIKAALIDGFKQDGTTLDDLIKFYFNANNAGTTRRDTAKALREIMQEWGYAGDFKWGAHDHASAEEILREIDPEYAKAFDKVQQQGEARRNAFAKSKRHMLGTAVSQAPIPIETDDPYSLTQRQYSYLDENGNRVNANVVWNKQDSTWEVHSKVIYDYEKNLNDAVKATKNMQKAQAELRRETNHDVITALNNQIAEYGRQLEKARTKAQNFKSIEIVNDTQWGTQYTSVDFEKDLAERTQGSQAEIGLIFANKDKNNILRTNKQLANYEKLLKDQQAKSQLPKYNISGDDMTALDEQYKVVLEKIEGLRGKSATDDELIAVKQLVDEYKRAVQAKIEYNNLTKKQLSGDDATNRVRDLIAEIDKAIAKSQQYGHATQGLTTDLQDQKKTLEGLLRTFAKNHDSKQLADEYYQSLAQYKASKIQLNTASTKQNNKLSKEQRRRRDEKQVIAAYEKYRNAQFNLNQAKFNPYNYLGDFADIPLKEDEVNQLFAEYLNKASQYSKHYRKKKVDTAGVNTTIASLYAESFGRIQVAPYVKQLRDAGADENFIGNWLSGITTKMGLFRAAFQQTGDLNGFIANIKTLTDELNQLRTGLSTDDAKMIGEINKQLNAMDKQTVKFDKIDMFNNKLNQLKERMNSLMAGWTGSADNKTDLANLLNGVNDLFANRNQYKKTGIWKHVDFGIESFGNNPTNSDIAAVFSGYLASQHYTGINILPFTENSKTLTAEFINQSGALETLTARYNQYTGTLQVTNGKIQSTMSFASGATKLLQQTFSRLSYYFSFYTLIRKGMQEIKQGIQTLKSFDAALTTISYTMDVSNKGLEDIGTSALQMADDLSMSIDNIMKIYQIYANMQTTAEEIQATAQPTAILANLSGVDTSTAADQVQGVLQQFNMLKDGSVDTAEASMHIVDVFDNISANVAIDYAKGIKIISDAVSASGQVAYDAGMSFETLAAVTAKVAERTREDGGSIGNAIKTMLTRISKVSTMPQYGDEIDNETVSNAAKSLHSVGVEVYTASGEFRNITQILTELNNVWDDLNDAQRANIAFNIAATRQSSKFKSMLEAWADAQVLAADATYSSGNALENQEKYEDSINGKLQKLQTEWKEYWLKVVNDDAFKSIIDFLTRITTGLNKLADSGHALLPILTTLATTFVTISKVKAAGGLTKLISGLKILRKSSNFAGSDFATLVGENASTYALAQSLKSLSIDEQVAAMSEQNLSKHRMKLILATNGATKAQIKEAAATYEGSVANTENAATTLTLSERYEQLALSLGLTKGAFAALLAAGLALVVITKLVKKHNEHMEEMRQRALEASKGVKEVADAQQSMIDRYAALKESLNDEELSNEEIYNIKKDIFAIQTEIVDSYSTQRENIDLVNKSLDEQSKILKRNARLETASEALRVINEETDANTLANAQKKTEKVRYESIHFDEQLSSAIEDIFENAGFKVLHQMTDGGQAGSYITGTASQIIDAYRQVTNILTLNADSLIGDIVSKNKSLTNQDKDRLTNSLNLTLDEMRATLQAYIEDYDEYIKVVNANLQNELFAKYDGNGLFDDKGKIITNANGDINRANLYYALQDASDALSDAMLKYGVDNEVTSSAYGQLEDLMELYDAYIPEDDPTRDTFKSAFSNAYDAYIRAYYDDYFTKLIDGRETAEFYDDILALIKRYKFDAYKFEKENDDKYSPLHRYIVNMFDAKYIPYDHIDDFVAKMVEYINNDFQTEAQKNKATLSYAEWITWDSGITEKAGSSKLLKNSEVIEKYKEAIGRVGDYLTKYREGKENIDIADLSTEFDNADSIFTLMGFDSIQSYIEKYPDDLGKALLSYIQNSYQYVMAGLNTGELKDMDMLTGTILGSINEASGGSNAIDELKNSYDVLMQTLGKIRDGYRFNQEDIDKLVQAYGLKTDSIYKTADGYKIEQEAIVNLVNDYVDFYNTAIAGQNELTRIEIKNIKTRIELMRKEALEARKANNEFFADIIADDVIDTPRIKELLERLKQLEESINEPIEEEIDTTGVSATIDWWEQKISGIEDSIEDINRELSNTEGIQAQIDAAETLKGKYDELAEAQMNHTTDLQAQFDEYAVKNKITAKEMAYITGAKGGIEEYAENDERKKVVEEAREMYNSIVESENAYSDTLQTQIENERKILDLKAQAAQKEEETYKAIADVETKSDSARLAAMEKAEKASEENYKRQKELIDADEQMTSAEKELAKQRLDAERESEKNANNNSKRELKQASAQSKSDLSSSTAERMIRNAERKSTSEAAQSYKDAIDELETNAIPALTKQLNDAKAEMDGFTGSVDSEAYRNARQNVENAKKALDSANDSILEYTSSLLQQDEALSNSRQSYQQSLSDNSYLDDATRLVAINEQINTNEADKYAKLQSLMAENADEVILEKLKDASESERKAMIDAWVSDAATNNQKAYYEAQSIIAESDANLSDLYKKQYDLTASQTESLIEGLESNKETIQAQIEQANGRGTVEKYQQLLSISEQEKDAYYEKLEAAYRYLWTLDKNSEEYRNQQSIINEISHSLENIDKEQKDINDSLMRIPIDYIQDKIDEIANTLSDIQFELDGYDKTVSAVDSVLDAHISKVQDELNLLTKQNEAREKTLAISKAEWELDKARNQKTTKIYREGLGFVYEANQEALRNAQEAYDSAQYEWQTYQLQLQIDRLEEIKSVWDKIATSSQQVADAMYLQAKYGSEWLENLVQTGNLDDAQEILANYTPLQTSKNYYEEATRLAEDAKSQMERVENSFLKGEITSDEATQKIKTIFDEASNNEIFINWENTFAVDSLREHMNSVVDTITNPNYTVAGVEQVANIIEGITDDTTEYIKGKISEVTQYGVNTFKEMTADSVSSTGIVAKTKAAKAMLSGAGESVNTASKGILKDLNGQYHAISSDYYASKYGEDSQMVTEIDSWLNSHRGGSYEEFTDFLDNLKKRRKNGEFHHSGLESGLAGGSSNLTRAQQLKMLGLKPLDANEIPAILQVGEAVLTAKQQRNLLGNMQSSFMAGLIQGVSTVRPVVPATNINVEFTGDMNFNQVQDIDEYFNAMSQKVKTIFTQQFAK